MYSVQYVKIAKKEAWIEFYLTCLINLFYVRLFVRGCYIYIILFWCTR